MNAIQFEGSNGVMKKPASMTDDECSDLPIQRTVNGGKFPAIESVWELTDEEVSQIVRTKRIRLGIVGMGMPPVYLSVEQSKIILP